MRKVTRRTMTLRCRVCRTVLVAVDIPPEALVSPEAVQAFAIPYFGPAMDSHAEAAPCRNDHLSLDFDKFRGTGRAEPTVATAEDAPHA